MTMRAPVAPNGWPRAMEPPWTLSRSGSTSPTGRGAAEPLRELRAGERLEVARHLRGEGLVHLDEVDVLQAHPGAVERDGRGVGRALQELVGRVDGGVGVGAEAAERLVARAPSPAPRASAAGPRRRRSAASCCPAVTEPYALSNTGFSLAAPRARCPARTMLSGGHRRRSVGGTGTCITWASNTPAFHAAAARWCEARAISSCQCARCGSPSPSSPRSGPW